MIKSNFELFFERFYRSANKYINYFIKDSREENSVKYCPAYTVVSQATPSTPQHHHRHAEKGSGAYAHMPYVRSGLLQSRALL